MLNLSTKEYDLNTLFSFESLKEILLELAKSQIKLENDIKNIQEDNKNRDITISNVQKMINNYKKQDSFNEINIEEQDNYNNNDKDNNFTNNYNDFKDKENHEEKKDNEIENKKIEENNKEKENENQEKDGNIHKNIVNDNSGKIVEKVKSPEKEGGHDILNNNDKNETNDHHEKSKDNNRNIKEEISSIYKNNLISPLMFKKMIKEINDQKARIIAIEENFKNELTNKKIEQNHIKNMSIENQNEFNSIKDKINALVQKNNDIDQKLELLQTNTKSLDIMTIFKDDGSGTIDATKVMVKALQEKVFKKFELVETRYKKEGAENFKTKTTVENLVPKIDKVNRDINEINDLNIRLKEEFDDYKKSNEEKNKETKIDIGIEIDKKVEKLRDEINKDMNNKILLIENKIKEINTAELETNRTNCGLEKENIKIIEKKISDLRKKTNDIDNTLKLYLKKNDIEIIRNELKDVKSSLETKLTKNDLKELYNQNLAHLDEINDIKDRFDMNEEEINKINKEIRTAMQKIEIFQGNLILLQNSSGQPGTKKIMDVSKYVEHPKLNEVINPIVLKIDGIIKEIDSIRRDMNEIEEINKTYSKNAITKFEEENTKQINEFKTFIQKKYLEKYDFNRTIKSIEVQIKTLNDDSKKRDADTWLLAKRNSNCFNCATCEANIKNDNYTTADYLAWKKYPKGEKIHRMGQGFSHMLEMVSSEFAKSIERNDFLNDNYDNNNNYINTVPDRMERASSTKLKIYKKELSPEDNLQNSKNLKKIGKMKLPKMTQTRIRLKKNENNANGNNQNSDDDNNTIEANSNSNNNLNIVGNYNSDTNNEKEKEKEKEKDVFQNIDGVPKIIKIIKKNAKNEFIYNTSDNFRTIQEERSRIEKDNNF
jgi:hypothetical protein